MDRKTLEQNYQKSFGASPAAELEQNYQRSGIDSLVQSVKKATQYNPSAPSTQPTQAAPAGASSSKQSDVMKEQLDAIKKQRDDAAIKAGAYMRAGNMPQQAKEQQKIANKAAIEYENAYTQWKNQRNAEAVEDYNPDENKFKAGDAVLSGVQNAFQSMRQYAAAASSYLSGNPEAQAWEAKAWMESGVSGTEAVKRAGLADKREIPITDYKTQAELRHEKNVASVGAVEGGALQLVNTISNMVPSLVANAILPGSGLPVMAASVAGNKYADAYEKYGNTDTAFVLGSAAGGASMLTEQFGGLYGSLGKSAAGQAVAKKLMEESPGLYNLANSVGGKWLRDALSEGIEEGAEDVINYAIEKALTGDSDEMDNFGYDMLLGALAGGVFGGGNAAMRSVTYSRVGKALNASPAAVAQQVQEGMEKGAGTAPAIYAAEVQKNPSNQMVGRLYEANLTYDAESGLSKIQNDITQVSINEIKAMVSKADALAQAAQKLNVEATPQAVATAITDAQRTQSIKTAEDSVGQAFAPTVDNPATAGEKAYNSALAGVAANQGVAARINNDPAARQAFSQLTGVQFSGNTAQDIAAIEVATQNIAKSGKQAISQAEYAQRVAAAGEQAAAQFDADMQAQAEQMQRESDERWLSVEQNTITDVDGKRRIKEITNTDVRGNTEIGYKKAEIPGSKKKAVAEVNNAAKYLGKAIVWFEGAVQVNGQYRLTNGYRAPDGTIYVNINSRDPLMVTFGHEMFHDLVADSKYSGLIDTLVENPDYADMVKGMMNAKTELYERNGIELDPNAAAEEVAADISGDLLGSRDMLEYIGARNTEAATGIKGFLNRILKKLKGKPSAQEAYNRLSEAQRALIDGMEDGARNIFADPAIGEDVKYSIREEAPPEKTILGYKVFVVKDGKLYPPMVANPNAEDTPVGVWLNADIGERAPDSKTGRMQVKAGGKGTQGGSGSLAFRPGWHLGEVPVASQFDRLNPETGKKELFPSNFVWAECLVAADIDYQEEAMSYGYTKSGKFQHSLAGLPKLPVDGYYKYRTNPRPDTVPWLITGAMKVNRILSDSDVAQILESKGITPPKRQGGEKTLEQLGLGKYADGKFSLIGVSNDGLEIYETSLATQQLSESQKKKQYLAIIKNQYRGRTARLERNGHVVYVRPDIQEAGKPIYGDRRSTANGAKALRNSLAEGDVFDLLENAEYDRSSRDTKNHKNADYFDYYVKTVQIDGKVYDLVADVKRAYGNSDGLYYTLYLVDNATKKAVVSQRPQTLGSSEPITASEMGSNSFSADMVPQSDTAVNNYSMQNSAEDASGKHSLMDIPAMDSEYSAAVESGNMQEAQRLVDEAAKAAGYNSEPLYHGTKSFGFTKIDTAQADDNISFFATSNPDMAQTYSGKKGNKAITNAAGNTRAMPIEDVVNRLNEEAINDGYEDGSSYRIMKRADVKSFLADLDRRIESLNDVIARKVDEYADRLAEDFSQNNITAHDTLVRLLEATENYRYSGMSTPLWMLSKHTDVFNESEKKLVGEIEADVRLRNRLEARGGSDDVVVREALDRYSISVMSFAEAREELAKLSASGNYSLRGRTDNFLDVDGNNHNWNEIFTTLEPKGGNNFLAEYNQDTGSVIMSDKDGRFAEVHASTLSDALPGMARAITKKFGSYFAPQILSSAKDQLRNGATAEVAVKSTGKMSTRDIAKFAKEQGYRGVKISNIYDNGGGGKDAGAGDVYIFFYPEEDVKSADPVTYDDAGNVIPLSERFNNSNKDIRYSLMEDAQYMADIDRVVSEATEKANDELKAAQAEVKDIRQQLADYRQQATAEAKNTAAWKEGETKLIADLSEAQSKEKKARALSSYMDEYNAISERYRGEVRATDSEALAQYNEKLSNLRSGFRGEMEKLAIEQGAFKRGEKAARDIYVPTSVNGQKVTRGTRTILEASQTPGSMLEEHAKEILAGARGYEVISDKKAQEYAERIIDKEGYDKADELFTNAVNGDQVLDKKTLVLGEYLYMEAAKAGDVKNAMRYAADVAAAATRAGQVVQAMRVLKKATPTGKLYYLNRMVDTMNKNIVDNGGDPIQIDEGLARKLLETENIKDPKEQGKAVDETIDEIEQNIADQIPATAWDKWNAWRYLSMLGNIRTQVRNVVGNAAFMPLVATKNLLAAGMEKAFIRNGGRTKSAFFTKTNVGKRLMEFGKKDFDTVVDEIQGGGKYNQSSSIEEKRTIFKSKAIEGWRKLTNKAMDKGDEIFSKHHYARALAGYLYANHLDYDKITRNTPQAQEVLNKARSYAILEAQKATFRDANQFASFINKTKRNLLKKAQTAETKGAKAGWYAGTAIAEGIMPFTKTPIDILARGVEYSPIGLIKGIKEAVYDVKKGNKTAAEAIDTLSAGLTGTGIFALGYFLQSLGLLAGALDDDKESKYKKDRGAQGFAIHIGDKYYTIDWLAPFSLPLFTGAAVAETVENGDEVSFATLADVFSTISEPMLEMSMLQGVNSALSNGQYSSDSKIVSFMTNQITGYLSQANPTILGQIARAVDDTSRNAYYYDPNYKGFVQTGKVFGDKQVAKIPFASKALTSRIDLWGNKQENTGGSFFGRLAYNMLSPGYYSEESNDPVDVALTKLYEETEDTAVLPSKPSKTVTNNKTDYKMNAKQYEEYCIVKGQTAHKEIQAFINSAEYKKMSNEDRVDVLEHLYKYSTYKAQKNLLEDKYVASSTYSRCVKAESYAKGGNPVYKYFLKG